MKKTNVVNMFIFIFAALCLLMFSACGNEPAESTAEPLCEPVAVKSLHSLNINIVPQMLPMGNGIALLCWCDYETGITHIAQLDTVNDTLLERVQLEGEYDLLEQGFDDGGFVLRNWENKTWHFYGDDFVQKRQLNTDDVWGVFSHDGLRYYFIKNNVLCVANTISGAVEKVTMPNELRMIDISAMHPSENQLAAAFMVSPYSQKSATAIIDLDSGEFAALQSELFQPRSMANSFALLHFDDEYMRYDVTYANNGSYRRANASLFKPGELVTVPGSNIMMGLGVSETYLYALGDELKCVPLSKYGIKGYVHLGKTIDDKGNILAGTYENGGFHPFIMNPAVMDFSVLGATEEVDSPFTVDTSLAEAYWGALAGEPVPESLSAVRQYADILEETYGVEILLGEQCKEPAELAYYPMTMTNELDITARDEAAMLYRALEAMDRCFALYPAGFLTQFTNEFREGGLCFLLIGGIQSDSNIIGMCFENYEYDYIAIDVTATGYESTICHEIWHATENFIITSGYEGFYIEQWQQLNPDGFNYYFNTDNYTDDLRWTYLGGEPKDNIYFIDGYGRVDAREDRARIMEYIMCMDDYAQDICDCPNIKAKLTVMCAAVRTAFDTDTWQDLRWERFLKD